jgi:predicted transcriptional regulator
MSNAVVKIRSVFQEKNTALTLRQINELLKDLKPSEISMALSYLLRQRYVKRTPVDNSNTGRKTVWLYQYYMTKLPKE